MKRLFFAAIAALALVSVSNVFASQSALIDDENTENTNAEELVIPADTIVDTPCDTTVVAE